MKNWYQLLERGISIGTQPPDFVDIDESVKPYGAVAYRRFLTRDEMRDYEMRAIGTEYEK